MERRAVSADAPIREVIEAALAAGGPLDVVEGGEVIGQVTAEAILAQLAARGGGQRAQG